MIRFVFLMDLALIFVHLSIPLLFVYLLAEIFVNIKDVNTKEFSFREPKFL